MPRNNLFLSIGGFYIRIVFSPTTLPLEKEILYEQIVSHYQKFIAPLSPKITPNHTVTFIDERHFHVLRQSSLYYTSFYFKKQGQIFTFYHISLSQFTLLIISLVQQLLQNNGFILHASGVRISNKVVLFTGPSGSGKSTISNILSTKFRQIADDSVIIRKENGVFYAYQTPLIEKISASFTRGKNKYPLEAVCFLNKTRRNPSLTITQQPISSISRLSHQLWLNRINKKQMKLLLSMISAGIGIFDLSFPKDQRILDFFERLQHDLRSHPGGRKQPVQVEH